MGIKIGLSSEKLFTVDEFFNKVNTHYPGVSYCDINFSLSCYDNSCGCGCGVGAPHADLIIERGAKIGENNINVNELLERIKNKHPNLSLNDVFIKVQAWGIEDFGNFAHNFKSDFSGYGNRVYWQIHIKNREDVEKKEKEDCEYMHQKRKKELEFLCQNSPNALVLRDPEKSLSGYESQYKLTDNNKAKIWTVIAVLGLAVVFPLGLASGMILLPTSQYAGEMGFVGAVIGFMVFAFGCIKTNSY
ncbi:MAG: hypothetical protein HYX20_01980 [Candidatus Yanofskybacteria bacterium]|nr:hypothetical protein [Candidatus Yanofskybacteria bacterium]